MALSLVLLIAIACSSSTTHSPTPAPRTLTGTIGAAAYQIEVPPSWNGTLFLYSHGYVPPGGDNIAAAAPGLDAGAWLLGNHFAIAGSSYSSTGWMVEDAFKDQIALLDYFGKVVGKPKRVIAWGVSLGGLITAGLVQLYPQRFAAAMPMCGVLSGGIATWNSELDATYAFKTLLAPTSHLQLAHITDPVANLQLAQDILAKATKSPAGVARVALVGALIDLPGWFDPRRPEPDSTNFAELAAGQANWVSFVDFPYAFRFRAELEQRAGGNPSWNTGVDYAHQLSISPDRDEVAALYQLAGLDLHADLGALNGGARISADPAAARYLSSFFSFDGHLGIPVLTIHDIADGLVMPANESAYASVVATAGDSRLLRQLFVHRAGHCAFTPAEVIAAAQVLLNRLDTGEWDDAALKPAALNASAFAQGDLLNTFFGGTAPAAFRDYIPSEYPRPFFKSWALPT